MDEPGQQHRRQQAPAEVEAAVGQRGAGGVLPLPIGMALKGHKVGDRVEVKVNDNYSYFLEIRSIDKTGSEDEEIRGF